MDSDQRRHRRGIPDREKTVFVLVDVQEKFIPVVKNAENMVKNIAILLKAADILAIPVIATEQYPRGLGPTSAKISLPENTCVIGKPISAALALKDLWTG